MSKKRLLEGHKLFRLCLAVFDLALVFVFGIAASYVYAPKPFITPHYWIALWVAVAISFLVFQQFGLYQPLREKRFFSHLVDITLALFLVAGLLTAVVFITQSGIYYSRIWFLIWLSFIWLALLFSRSILWLVLRFFRKHGWNVRRVLIIGVNEHAQKVAREINQSLWTGVRIVGFVDEQGICLEKNINGIKVRHMPRNLAKFVRRLRVNDVWIVKPLKEEEGIKSIAYNLRNVSVSVRYIPDLFGLSLHQHAMSEVLGFPLLDLYSSPLQGFNRVLKEFEDKLLASLFLIIASPFMLLIALSIKLTSPGPVLFKQKRHGWNGKKIKVYKFRTMKQHKVEHGKILQAKRGDKRVTKIGRFLRSSSLDELPQFFNVLQGTMSIVGPRPHAIEHNEHYKNLIKSYMQRNKVKPGITGWAQVNGWRGETDTLDKMEKRVEYDLFYIENWHFLFDVKIIFMTAFKGFFGKRVY